ncbi:MAG: thiamine-monophosphate kinase [Candidatus Omnitrophota bacterium]|nr:MAG: thiamine-monophosphate kinase [Candidatus Omnitrophota bacterium]
MKLDELRWVDLLKQRAAKRKGVIVGIGDDCAQVLVGKNKVLLKSDLFVEGVHFRRGKVSYKTIGMRAAARVLSDFAACAGIPKFVGVSAGLPAYLRKKDLEDILSGILFYGKKYKFSLVGGDTVKSSKLFLDVWGVGEAKKFVSRAGAKGGDYIFITGPLGRRAFAARFEPRIKEAQGLVNNFKVNSMIDISDGFILDLYRILKESKKGALLYHKNLPLTRGEEDLWRGEDYELIFTVDRRERIEQLKKKFYFVGRIKEKNFGYKIEKNNRIEKVRLRGYTHF